MKQLKIFFLFLLLLPSVALAFDCSYFQDQTECLALNEYNESLIANLIYTNTSSPNHQFINQYNNNIQVNNAPEGTIPKSSGNLKNMWFTFLTASPSILYEEQLLVPSTFTLRSEYHFEYTIPDTYYNSKKKRGRTCQIKYYYHSSSDNLKIYANEQYLSNQKTATFVISKPVTFRGVYTASITVRERYYEWGYDHGWDCDYDHTEYNTNTLTVEDTFNVINYQEPIEPDFEVKHIYNQNIIGEKNNTQNNIEILFDNSFYKELFYTYDAVFTKKPYYFLTLRAINSTAKESRNLFLNQNTITVKNENTCTVKYNNFFETEEKECTYNLQEINATEFQTQSFSSSWNFLFVIAIFVFVLWLFYIGIKKTWGKAIIPVLLLLLFIPSVSAEECGLTNLATCIPEKIYGFFIDMLNAPLQPLLSSIRSLMENAPSIEIFQGIWAIMVYCISLFYGLLFLYSGLQFLISGHNIIKREIAKEWLRNTVIMIVLIQASFYLYKLILEIGAVMTSAVLSMVNEQFFLLTADNLANLGLEFLFVTLYAITLLITLLFLLIRYLIVSFGVIFMPVGIFCYFVPPLKSYGKLILHMLGSFIFITFIYSIIILGCSMLVELPIFENVKIMVMIACFSIINIIFIIIIIKQIFKSVFGGGNGGAELAQVIKYIGMLA